MTEIDWSESVVMVTGGTGSFGRKCVEILLKDFGPKKLIVFSRDELKQYEMRSEGFVDRSLRYFVGDVRDRDRLRRAMLGVDIVIHAAAMKQVPACEYNPSEAVQTNVGGAQNIVDAAIDCGVRRVVALSTDKAVNPVNLYGATKLCAEKLFVQGNSYSGAQDTRFSCTRYGNVLGSRGSAVSLFRAQRTKGVVTVTDKRMTRFWLSLEDGVRFVLSRLEEMQGGEIFVPRIPSMAVVDLADAVAPGCEIRFIGIRPGEKLHEVLISRDEARHALWTGSTYVILPEYPWWTSKTTTEGTALPADFELSSDRNELWLSRDKLMQMLEEM